MISTYHDQHRFVNEPDFVSLLHKLADLSVPVADTLMEKYSTN